MSPLPLSGLRVLEVAGLAPAPFAGMILADWGADVVRIDRADAKTGFAVGAGPDDLARGKRSAALDLKQPRGRDALRHMARTADVLIEPFRPGVMERLGLGPAELLDANPRLIYARMTGFGQGGDGAWSRAAGHDHNYLALSGVLSMLRQRRSEEGAPGGTVDALPFAPLNLLGDFAGGGLMCALGVLLAVIERHTSGKGQVVDAAMVDGAAYIATSLFKGVYSGALRNGADDTGSNGFNQAAHWNAIYRTKDPGGMVAVQSVEPQFYAALLKGLGIPAREAPQMDRARWPELKARVGAVFATRTRAEWAEVFRGADACVVPVLTMVEAAAHEHNAARGVFAATPGGGGKGPRALPVTAMEPAPAPKLSRTPGAPPRASPRVGQHTVAVLDEYRVPGGGDAAVAAGAASATPAPRRSRRAKL